MINLPWVILWQKSKVEWDLVNWERLGWQCLESGALWPYYCLLIGAFDLALKEFCNLGLPSLERHWSRSWYKKPGCQWETWVTRCHHWVNLAKKLFRRRLSHDHLSLFLKVDITPFLGWSLCAALSHRKDFETRCLVSLCCWFLRIDEFERSPGACRLRKIPIRCRRLTVSCGTLDFLSIILFDYRELLLLNLLVSIKLLCGFHLLLYICRWLSYRVVL
jgi:hypothetical protein